MSLLKKQIRLKFREDCLKRDGFKCVMCEHKPANPDDLDVHHITDRNEIPNGGYVKENGISLCSDCHIKAEQYHITGVAFPKYSPDELYKKIGSSKELAFKKAELL